MTALTSTAPAASPPRPAAHARWPAWTREPLLHFLLLGGLVLAADRLMLARADDPRAIVVDAQVDAQASGLFKAARGRAPDAGELAALRQAWLDNEVLYREGLALQVDKGDPAIRERVIFKALSVVDASVKLPAVDDQALRAWFESHRAKYDDPARLDFQEAVLAGGSAEAAARAFAQRLNAGLAAGDADAGLRVFKGRPYANLAQSYGVDFATALQAAPTARWQALHAADGWRVVRLDRFAPARPADFKTLRPVVLQDWTDATLSEQRSAAVHALARKYAIRVEDGAR